MKRIIFYQTPLKFRFADDLTDKLDQIFAYENGNHECGSTVERSFTNYNLSAGYRQLIHTRKQLFLFHL